MNTSRDKWKKLKTKNVTRRPQSRRKKKKSNPLNQKFEFKRNSKNDFFTNQREDSGSVTRTRRTVGLKKSLMEVRAIKDSFVAEEMKRRASFMDFKRSVQQQARSGLQRNDSCLSNLTKNSQRSYNSGVSHPRGIRRVASRPVYRGLEQGNNSFENYYVNSNPNPLANSCVRTSSSKVLVARNRVGSPRDQDLKNNESVLRSVSSHSNLQNNIKRVYYDSSRVRVPQNYQKIDFQPLTSRSQIQFSRPLSPKNLPRRSPEQYKGVRRFVNIPESVKNEIAVKRQMVLISPDKYQERISFISNSSQKSSNNDFSLKKNSTSYSKQLYFYEPTSQDYKIDQETNEQEHYTSFNGSQNSIDFDKEKKNSIQKFSPRSHSVAPQLKTDQDEQFNNEIRDLHCEITDNIFNQNLRKFLFIKFFKKSINLKKIAKVNKCSKLPLCLFERGSKISKSWVKRKSGMAIDESDEPSFKDSNSEIMKKYFCKKMPEIEEEEDNPVEEEGRMSLVPELTPKMGKGKDVSENFSKDYFSASSDFSLMVIFKAKNIFQFL